MATARPAPPSPGPGWNPGPAPGLGPSPASNPNPPPLPPRPSPSPSPGLSSWPPTMSRRSSEDSEATLPPSYQDEDANGEGSGNDDQDRIQDVSGGPSRRWLTVDPRESSSQSLVPSTSGDPDADMRRRLLIVYIHGFYGNDQSFQSFPAHIHGYLKDALHETHVVHTKIYPRYKTYKAIEIARDNFSSWLEPHESPTTDVILVGHSMGGILAAEIVLIPNRDPYSSHPFKHRILGHISLDCPFLGLHPGIIVSGIASLFRPSPSEPTSPNQQEDQDDDRMSLQADSATEETSLAAQSSPSLSPDPTVARRDPSFNPPFFNDVSFKERPFRQRLTRFVKKHSSEGIFHAARNHFLSHLEFGGCLADYPALNSRYNKIRALEDVDELKVLRQQDGSGSGGNQRNQKNQKKRREARVRFVNYYTLSTGRPKDDKSEASTPSPSPLPTPTEEITSPRQGGPQEDAQKLGDALRSEARNDNENVATSGPQDAPPTPAIQIDSPGKAEAEEILAPSEPSAHDDAKTRSSRPGPEPLSAPKGGDEIPGVVVGDANPTQTSAEERDQSESFGLPAIPDLPEKPQPLDPYRYPDKESRKQAEKEAKRDQKSYEQAVKNRERALRERQKLADKRRRKSEKELVKSEKEAEKKRAAEEKQARRETEQDRGRNRNQEIEKVEVEEQKPEGDDEEPERKRQGEEEDVLNYTAPPAQETGEPPMPESFHPLSRWQPETHDIGAHRPETPADDEAKDEEQARKEEQEEEVAKAEREAAAKEAAKHAQAKAKAKARERKEQKAREKKNKAHDGHGKTEAEKPAKERKFCVLPRKVAEGKDQTWAPVKMEGVDEVGAHCGLFFPPAAGDEEEETCDEGSRAEVDEQRQQQQQQQQGNHYDRLIGDVGERIVNWTQEELSKQAILGLAESTDNFRV